ncbi:MAG: DeoR family transcriptional regulator, partial [Dysgonamonadaceae bacterium]|nr:DeoR family transcriptional regulator [Dysgonamonadaceae bacterium]
FIVTLFKDRFSEKQLQQLGLNERQIKAVLYVKEKGKITNKEYQELNSVSRQTASNDLSEIVAKYLIFSNAGVGAGSCYEISSSILGNY